MSDSELFKQFAKETMVASVASKDENEKRVLDELSGMWGKAATVSERMFTSPPLVPRADEAKPLFVLNPAPRFTFRCKRIRDPVRLTAWRRDGDVVAVANAPKALR
jgi:hypothetical protein